MTMTLKEVAEVGPSDDHPSSAGKSFEVIFAGERNETGNLIIDKRGLRLGSVGNKIALSATIMTFKVGNQKREGVPPDFADMILATGLAADLTVEGTLKIDDLAEWDYFAPILNIIGTAEIETFPFAFR